MDTTRYIVPGHFIDGTGVAARKMVFLAVKDGIITAVESTANLPAEANAAIEDFSHCTLVPALVDCSVSLACSPSVDARVRNALATSGAAEKAALFARHVGYCHAHGVLGVADSGEATGLVAQGQAGRVQEDILTIRFAGRLPMDGDEETITGSRNDFLRITYSADIEADGPLSLRLRQEDLRQILVQHTTLKKVVVANGQGAVAEALAAGCDAIEQGYMMGEENLKHMAANKVLWIPSLLRAKNGLDSSSSGGEVCCRFSTRYVAPGKPAPGAEAFWKKILADQLAQLQLARTWGVRTAVGTGAGSTGILHGESMVEEMKLFIKAGYSLEETIYCASEQGARFFGMERLGALTVGRRATFLLTRGTPHQLPRKLSYLEGIAINGAPSTAYRKNPVKAGRQP